MLIPLENRLRDREIENRKYKHVVYLSSTSHYLIALQQGTRMAAKKKAGKGKVAVNVRAEINDEIVHLGNNFCKDLHENLLLLGYRNDSLACRER